MKFRYVTLSSCRHRHYTLRVRWHDAEGRERCRWFTGQTEAERFARQTETELRATRPGTSAPLTNEEAVAVHRLRSFRAGHDSAPSVLTIIEEGIGAATQPLRPLTAIQLVAERLAFLEQAGTGPRHLADVRRELDHFAAAFTTKLVRTVSTEELEGWLNRGGVGPQTFCHRRARLFAACEWACQRGWLRENLIRRIERRHVPRPEPEILTPAEMLALLNHASDRIRPLIFLQGFCGLRRAEAERLQWKHIRFPNGVEEGHIEVPVKVAKTARRRLGHLPASARLWLHCLAGAPDAALGVHIEVYRRDLARAWKLAAPGKRWSPNCLRHSFGSYFLASHRDEARTAAVMGNSVGMVRSHYLALTTTAVAAEYWSVTPTAGPALAALERVSIEAGTDHEGEIEARRRRLIAALANAEPEILDACERLLDATPGGGNVVPFEPARSA